MEKTPARTTNPGIVALHRAVASAVADYAASHDLTAEQIEGYFRQSAEAMAHAKAFGLKGKDLAAAVRAEIEGNYLP